MTIGQTTEAGPAPFALFSQFAYPSDFCIFVSDYKF